MQISEPDSEGDYGHGLPPPKLLKVRNNMDKKSTAMVKNHLLMGIGGLILVIILVISGAYILNVSNSIIALLGAFVLLVGILMVFIMVAGFMLLWEDIKRKKHF